MVANVARPWSGYRIDHYAPWGFLFLPPLPAAMQDHDHKALAVFVHELFMYANNDYPIEFRHGGYAIPNRLHYGPDI